MDSFELEYLFSNSSMDEASDVDDIIEGGGGEQALDCELEAGDIVPDFAVSGEIGMNVFLSLRSALICDFKL